MTRESIPTSMLSPGLSYLLRLLPVFVLYPLFIFQALRYVSHRSVPIALLAFISILSPPITFFFLQLLNETRNTLRARSIGAVIPPQVQDNSFGVIAKLRRMSTDYPTEIFGIWMEQYGATYSFSIFSEYRIFTAHPEHLKALLATQFNEFFKGPALFDQLKSLLGTGVFNSDDEMWKFHRTMTRPFFTKDRISDFDVFDRHAEDVIGQLKQRLQKGYPVEFQDAISRFTLDCATEFLFGKDVGSLSVGMPYPPGSKQSQGDDKVKAEHPSTKFVNAFALGQLHSARRARLGLHWRFLEMKRDEVLAQRELVNGFVDPIIDEALQRYKAQGIDDSKSEEEETMLEHLIRHTQDYKVIEDELVNILVASRDTTASTLTFAVYMLTEHPEITTRLREEILTRVGPNRRPNHDDIRNMKYLRAFLNEVLRLYPPVPFNARTSTHDTTLPGVVETDGRPTFVPKGTKVVYSVFQMHRRPELWGPDAAKFDPDRFIDDRLKKYLTPNPFIFLPFNAGPRICLGQQFAYNEASFFLIRLLQKFSEFSLAQDVQPEETKPPLSWRDSPGTKGTDKIRFHLTLTMSVEGGMWMRMK